MGKCCAVLVIRKGTGGCIIPDFLCFFIVGENTHDAGKNTRCNRAINDGSFVRPCNIAESLLVFCPFLHLYVTSLIA